MSRKRSKRPCVFTGCTQHGLGRNPYCRGHYFLIPKAVRDELVETWRKQGMHVVHQTIIPRANAMIQRAIDNGSRPGVSRRLCAPRVVRPFLGNSRSDE